MVLRKRKKYSHVKKPHGQHGKRNRGKGNRGGVGRSGVGKMAKHKKQSMSGELGKYILKPKSKFKEITLERLPAGKEVVLKGYKLLGTGRGVNAVIKVSAATKSAIEKVEKAGGKVELI